MKKKLFLILLTVSLFACLFAITVNAGTFGEADTTAGIPVGSVITDTESQIQMSDGKIYPSYYFFNDSTTAKFKFDAVTKADGTAYTKGDIVKVEIPEGIVQFEDYNFTQGKCTLLEYVTFPSTVVTITRQAFTNCPSLTSVTIPDNVKTIGPRAFSACKALTEVIINPTSQLKTIESEAFKNTAVQSFYFPNTLETLGSAVFAYNEKASLTTLVNFENCAVTSIPKELFRQCIGLKTIKFPKGITTINGSNLFSNCNVDTIYLPKTLQTISNPITVKSINKVIFAAEEGTSLPANFPSSTTLEYANYCEVYLNGSHQQSEKYELDFDDFITSFNEVSVCTNCGKKSKVNEKDFDPIFVFSGYSVKESEPTAICAGYTVNHKSLGIYKKYNPNAVLEYGFVAVKSSENNKVLEYKDGSVVASNEKAVLVPVEGAYAGFDFILRGFNNDGSQDNVELVISAYIGNGTEIFYMSNTYGDAPETITLAKARGNE